MAQQRRGSLIWANLHPKRARCENKKSKGSLGTVILWVGLGSLSVCQSILSEKVEISFGELEISALGIDSQELV